MAITTFYGNLANYLCIPTENDHYGSGYGGVGAGMIPTELNFVPLLAGLSPVPGHVISGFTVPSSGSLSGGYIVGTVAAGDAIVNGYRIVGTDTITINMTPSDTNYIFLKLDPDANDRVYRPLIVVDDGTYSIPSGSIPLGSVTCGASSVTSTKDYRTEYKCCYGVVDTDGTRLNAGSGDWTSSGSSGVYSVAFTTSFRRAPCVHVMVHSTSTSYMSLALVSSVAVGGFDITTKDDTDSNGSYATTAKAFSFIAYS